MKTIKGWYVKFRKTDSVGDQRSDTSRVTDETVGAVHTAFERFPKKKTYRASNELDIPPSTAVKILHKQLQNANHASFLAR